MTVRASKIWPQHFLIFYLLIGSAWFPSFNKVSGFHSSSSPGCERADKERRWCYLVWASPPSPGAEWSRAGPCWRWGRRARWGWRSSREFSGGCGQWRWCQHRAQGSSRRSHCSSSRELLAPEKCAANITLSLDLGFWSVWLFLLNISCCVTFHAIQQTGNFNLIFIDKDKK